LARNVLNSQVEEDPMMICPECPEPTQVAYSAITGSLVCLGEGCTWERVLDEEETFRLFFGSRAGRTDEDMDLVRAGLVAEKVS
jgi:hypothetical protein